MDCRLLGRSNAAPVNPLIRLIPAPLVRFFAKPYVAGDSLAKALEACATLWHRDGVLSTLDLLAEDIETQAAADRNIETYLEMVREVAADDRYASEADRPTLSLKPSSYTTDPLDGESGRATGAAQAIERICEAARERGVRVTIDMESRHWTDFTLDLLRDLHAKGHDHVGAVIQSRLHRTEADLDRLPPGCRVRVVIGIYQEPAAVALTDKEAMKERMWAFSNTLLDRGHFVEFGSHDEKWVRRFTEGALERFGADRFEIQMLYGVPRAALVEELQQRGVRVRQYVPFALSWDMAIAYLRRRLQEFPTMMFLVAKNWLRRR